MCRSFLDLGSHNCQLLVLILGQMECYSGSPFLHLFCLRHCLCLLIVSDFTFKSLIHIVFIVFMQGYRYKYNNIIFVHADIQFSQHHLLMMLSFLLKRCFWHLCQILNSWSYVNSWVELQFHCFACLFQWQCHIAFIPRALQLILTFGMVVLPALFFVFTIVWFLWSLLWFKKWILA